MPRPPQVTDAELPGRFSELQNAFTLPEMSSIWLQVGMLVLGGVLAMFLRLLYRMSNRQAAADSIARVFPLLTIVTIAVIAVVKSSLALSLGLVGALSIVRFRAAIKDPEELVYLFLCIGVGLSLGAAQVWPAIFLVLIAALFALVFDRFRSRRGSAFLTVTGSAADYFGESAVALDSVKKVFPSLTVERCDVDGDEGQLRVKLHGVDPQAAPKSLAQLRASLADCDLSYVNAESLP